MSTRRHARHTETPVHVQPATTENMPALRCKKNSRTSTPLLIQSSLVGGSRCSHGMMSRTVTDSVSGSRTPIAMAFQYLVTRASIALRATLMTIYDLGRRFESSQQVKLAASFGSRQQVGPFPLSRVILQHLALFTSTSHARDTCSLAKTAAIRFAFSDYGAFFDLP
jgi:hypothetical protein